MLTAESLPRLTPEQYLHHERVSDVRHELVDGYLYAMTGASDRHNEIAGNLFAALHAHLRGSGCRVYISDMKLRIADNFYYPDILVRCGDTPQDTYFKTDPVLLIEVLSPNTRRFDRGDKWLAYRGLASLQEYVLVEQDQTQVEVWRCDAGDWQHRVHRQLSDTLTLASVGLNLPLAEVYR